MNLIILEDLKKYFEEKITDGYHKLFYGDNGEFKTVDAITTLNIVSEYENKLKLIESYLDKQPDIPLDIEINIKNIIHNDENEVD